jgi:hypothetical protein
MKVLEVSGDSDYGAMIFEENNYDVKEMYDKTVQAGGELEIEVKSNIDEEEEEESEETLYLKSHEFFGDVDIKFIDFIQDEFMDYDSCKCHNFFIVKE